MSIFLTLNAEIKSPSLRVRKLLKKIYTYERSHSFSVLPKFTGMSHMLKDEDAF